AIDSSASGQRSKGARASGISAPASSASSWPGQPGREIQFIGRASLIVAKRRKGKRRAARREAPGGAPSGSAVQRRDAQQVHAAAVGGQHAHAETLDLDGLVALGQ